MEFIKWLVTSSSDPTRYSLMVKGTLSMGLAWMIQAVAVTCGLHLLCIDTSVLSSAIDTLANIVYLGLSLIGAVAFLFGLVRKVWFNRISAYVPPPSNLPTA